MAIGFAFFYCGVALICLSSGDGTIVTIGVLSCIVGAPLAWIGTRNLILDRAFNKERARAHEEWADLRKGVAEAKQQGKTVEQYLHDRGYSVHGVIRWIAHDLAREPHAE